MALAAGLKYSFVRAKQAKQDKSVKLKCPKNFIKQQPFGLMIFVANDSSFFAGSIFILNDDVVEDTGCLLCVR